MYIYISENMYIYISENMYIYISDCQEGLLEMAQIQKISA